MPGDDNQPVPLTQIELNDLIQDLNLSKELAQLLVSRLEGKHLLAPETTTGQLVDGLQQKKKTGFH